MALFDEKTEEGATPPPAITPHIEPAVFDGITVDTEYTPSSALLTWVEGSNWTVDYYSQVLGSDNEPTPQDINRDPIYQQYKLIKAMDLKVTNPLSFSQDPQLRTMEVRGSGITYPFLVPNKGDMFVADVGDGRVGVFTITEALRSTILRDSVYTVEFMMVAELDRTRLNDLERKTIETYHYSQDSLIRGCGPFVTEQEKTRHQRYAELRHELIRRYLTDFLSQEHSTLLVPDQLRKTYDHFVTRAVNMLVSTQDDMRLRRVKELNVTAEPVMSQPTLWDALIRLDDTRLYGTTQKATCLSTNYFRGRPTMQALGYTGISRVVFPMEASTAVDAQYDSEDATVPQGIPFREGRPRRPLEGPHKDQATRNPIYFQTTPLSHGIEPWKLPADIHPVVKDEYYVLSRAFYQRDKPAQSKLEQLTYQALRGEALNLDQLDHVLERTLEWDNLERYYYHPILFVLLKLGMQG